MIKYHKLVLITAYLFQCEGWVNEASQFLVQIGRKATECKTSQDANELIDALNNFKNEGAANQDARLGDMEKIAVALYGKICKGFVL